MKKKLKGFTLLEMIIVLALFSLVMYSVVQLLDPVSKYFVRSSNFESTTACVDNMKRAIEGNLKFANRVRVYANYDPAATLDSNVESFYNEFFKDRQVLETNGRICALVFDNSVPSLSGCTKLNEFNANKMNSGKISYYEFTFDKSAVNTTPSQSIDWYVNQKIYGNYDYQFTLGSTTGAKEEGAEFDPSDCTISISCYEIVRPGGGKNLQFNPNPQISIASFSMKNVLDATAKYTKPLDDFRLIVNDKYDISDPLYSIDHEKKYVKDTANPIPRYKSVEINEGATNTFNADILTQMATFYSEDPSKAAVVNQGFYFIYTLPEYVNDDLDADYLKAVDDLFSGKTPVT